MSTLTEKYIKIVDWISNDSLTWVKHTGVPFIICTYDNAENKDVGYMINKMKQDIIDYHIEIINMEKIIFDIIDEHETIDNIIQIEKSKEESNLVTELGELLLEEVRSYFIAKAKELGPKGRIVVTRVGSTAIYFNFVRLLSYLEGRVQIPLIFLYPGSFDKFSVSLLNKYKETALRALII